MDYRDMKKGTGLIWVCLILILMGGCEDDSVFPNLEIGETTDYFVSSLDTSLVHSEDAYGAIFLEDVSFSINTKQYEALKEISFRVLPKGESSLVDTFTVSYSKPYIESKCYFDSTSMQITFPVFGLFDAYLNTILITSRFSNGQNWESTLKIETKLYPNSEENNMTMVSPTTDIGVSYFLMETDYGAMIMDIEGNIRWVAEEFLAETNPAYVFLENNFYCKTQNTPFNYLTKLGFDGNRDSIAVECGDYPGAAFHHEINLSDKGILLELNIKNGKSFEKRNSVLIEVDKEGKLLQTWDMDEIIGKCLAESGLPVDTFIRNAYNSANAIDWFHMNSQVYDASDNTVFISSRENFVIKVGYSDKEIKWILGDSTKYWHSLDTLRHYALHLTEGNINIGQHSLSILDNGELLMFNNGEDSYVSFFPKDKLGLTYPNSMISSYMISGQTGTAKEVFNLDLPYYSPNRGCVQKYGEAYIVTSLPVQPEYSSVIDLFDKEGNLLLKVTNYNYFCVRTYGFSNMLVF